MCTGAAGNLSASCYWGLKGIRAGMWLAVHKTNPLYQPESVGFVKERLQDDWTASGVKLVGGKIHDVYLLTTRNHL